MRVHVFSLHLAKFCKLYVLVGCVLLIVVVFFVVYFFFFVVVFVSCLCLWIVQSQFSLTFICYTEETKLTVLFHIWIMLFYLCHPFHTNHMTSMMHIYVFEFRSGQICYFSDQHPSLWSTNKGWLIRSRVYISWLSYMSTCLLWCEWGSNVDILFKVFV
jgi:hypothetical protein